MTLEPDPAHGLNLWNVERLRATTFHPTSIDFEQGTKWWQEVIGESPDQVLTRPKQRVSQQSGDLDENQVTLLVRPERVDWNIQAATDDSDELGQEFETLGPFTSALEPYSKLVNSWLMICPTSSRLAFGAVLVRQVTDFASAIGVLSKYLPDVRLDETGSEDFLYQINRPRDSRQKPGLRINRLTKWSVTQFGTISLELGPSSGNLMSGPRQLACQLELDINTPANSSKPFAREEVGKLFLELLELGKELALEGDIP